MNGSTRGVLLALLITAPTGLLAAEVGQPAPEISLPPLVSHQNADQGTRTSPIRLADYRGKVVYVHFWSAWCASCRTTIPELAALRDQLPRSEFEVLSVNVDTLVGDGRRALATTPVGHPVASDALQIAAEAYGVDALPAGVLVDAGGLVRGNLQGRAAADVGSLRQALVPLMSGGLAASIR